ncbi:MAG: hypothetical protein MHPSP_001634, partial [Paramarteilia canceri]
MKILKADETIVKGLKRIEIDVFEKMKDTSLFSLQVLRNQEFNDQCRKMLEVNQDHRLELVENFEFTLILLQSKLDFLKRIEKSKKVKINKKILNMRKDSKSEAEQKDSPHSGSIADLNELER